MTATENGRSLGEFRMPDVGEGLTEAEIIEWYVEPGDTVSDGQLVCEVESAKSAVELPIPFDGVVQEILAPVGATVDVGAVIIVVDREPARSPLAEPRRAPVAEPEGRSPLAGPPHRADGAADTGDHEQVRWTPVNGGPAGWTPVADDRAEPRRHPVEPGRRPAQSEQSGPHRRPPAGRPGSTEQGDRPAYTDPGRRPPPAQRSPLSDPQRRGAGDDRGGRPANDVRRPPAGERAQPGDEHGERRHPTGEQAARPPLSGQPRRPPATEWPTRPPSRPVADRGRPLQGERPQVERPYTERPHAERPHAERSHSERPHTERPQTEPSHGGRPRGERPDRVPAASETVAQPIVPDVGRSGPRAPEWASDLFAPGEPEPVDPDRGIPARRPAAETRPVREPAYDTGGDPGGDTAGAEPRARVERSPDTAPFPVRAAAERAPQRVEPAGVDEEPGRPLAKPPVRKLARDLGVELAEVQASGPSGVVTREDVHAAREQAGQDAVEREVAALQALVDVELAEIPVAIVDHAADEPAVEPVAEEPVVEERVVEEPAAEEPAVEERAAEPSAVEEPVAAEQPGEPVVEQPDEPLPAGVLDTLSAAYPAGPATDLMISWSTVSSVSPDEGVRRVPVTGVRKATARAMVTSAFTAPHVTEFVTVDVTRTMKLVASLKDDPVFAGIRIGPLLIVAKALLVAVARNPGINAAWDEERQEILQKERVNLGIAAATPRGLIVPNIPDAGRFTLRQLAGELDQLVGTARAGRTQPGAMRDGTITITNIGVFGVDTGTPILNPGESAILAFGAVKELPWVHRGEVRPRKVTTLALSFDHRVVDGELGSHVLSDVAAILERPKRLFAWT